MFCRSVGVESMLKFFAQYAFNFGILLVGQCLFKLITFQGNRRINGVLLTQDYEFIHCHAATLHHTPNLVNIIFTIDVDKGNEVG